MAKFSTDLRDLYFNLFELVKVQNNTDQMEESDLKEIINQFNNFVENEIYPTREDGDQIGVKLTDNGVVVPQSFQKPQKLFYENGWFALGIDEEYGGMPVPEAITSSCTSIAIGANMAFSMYFGLSKAAMNVILKIGSDEQKSMFVEKMMNGTWGGTMCLTEPMAGSDVGAVTTTATPREDGKYNISGVKIFISSGESDLYENNIHLVLARTPGAPKGTKGLSLFIVPRFLINDDGTNGKINNVICTKIEEKMGIHGSATCELTFGENGDCVGELIGKEFFGMPNMFIMMNEARVLCGMQGESQANLAYELSYQYAKERSQFGQEIIKFPDVKRLLLKMRAMSRGMRALNVYVTNLFDLEESSEDVAKEIALLTPICKSYNSDEGFNVSVDAVQVHGGYGYCQEYGVEQFVRDSKIASIYEGTNAIQAADFILRKIMKDGGVAFSKIGEKISSSCKKAKEKNFEESSTNLIFDSVIKISELMKKFTVLAKGNEVDQILFSSSNFLKYCGNMVVAWRLLESAILAREIIDEGRFSGDSEKSYYESKIVDYKVFVSQYLTENAGLFQSMMIETDKELIGLEL